MKNVRPTAERFEFSDRSVILYVSEVFEVTHSFAMLTCYQIFSKSARFWKQLLSLLAVTFFKKVYGSLSFATDHNSFTEIFW